MERYKGNLREGKRDRGKERQREEE